MQKEIVSHDVKCNPCFSVKDIFLYDHNWDVYRHQHRDDLRQVEVDEVEKMLHCKDGSRGFFVYHCPRCDESRIVYLGCNSRLCSCCGKNYTDKWSKSLKKAMFDVVHRHIVITYSFDQLLKSIYEINEITSQSSSLFLLHVSDPSLFTDTQLRLLQSELTVIPGKTLKDYLPDLELYTLFKYMKNEEKKYDTISFNQLRKKLHRSYPTIRKNAYSLKEKGFVEIVKKGREKIVFLTEKGKQIIKRCES